MRRRGNKNNKKKAPTTATAISKQALQRWQFFYMHAYLSA